MGLTKAQRHNRMLDRVFLNYEKNKKDPVIKSHKRHSRKIGLAVKDVGDRYPGPKSRALDNHK